MLDMHKLKLKYRELSSQYAENLMKPVFKTSKRSYTYLPNDSPDVIRHRQGSRDLENIMNSAEHDFATTANNVSPQNELLGETATKLKADMSDAGEENK